MTFSEKASERWGPCAGRLLSQFQIVLGLGLVRVQLVLCIYIYIDVRDGFGGLDLFGGCIERLSPCSQTHQLFLFGIVFEMPNEALF